MRQSEWEKEKAIHILELVRSELYMDMPHFLTALNTLVLKEDERVAIYVRQMACIFTIIH